jgi:hypothetical protein
LGIYQEERREAGLNERMNAVLEGKGAEERTESMWKERANVMQQARAILRRQRRSSVSNKNAITVKPICLQ